MNNVIKWYKVNSAFLILLFFFLAVMDAHSDSDSETESFVDASEELDSEIKETNIRSSQRNFSVGIQSEELNVDKIISELVSSTSSADADDSSKNNSDDTKKDTTQQTDKGSENSASVDKNISVTNEAEDVQSKSESNCDKLLEDLASQDSESYSEAVASSLPDEDDKPEADAGGDAHEEEIITEEEIMREKEALMTEEEKEVKCVFIFFVCFADH